MVFQHTQLLLKAARMVGCSWQCRYGEHGSSPPLRGSAEGFRHQHIAIGAAWREKDARLPSHQEVHAHLKHSASRGSLAVALRAPPTLAHLQLTTRLGKADRPGAWRPCPQAPSPSADGHLAPPGSYRALRSAPLT